MQGNYDACRPLLESALTIAQANGLVQLEAECWLAFSALADTHGGDFALARQHGEQALTLFQRMGNRTGELRMLILLGNFGWGVGDYALAQDYYEQSLVISRDIASQQDEAATLANLGTVLREQGEYAQAILYYAQAIQLFQKRHDQRREFITLKNMSLLQHQQAQPLLALRYARQSLAMARELETRAGESQPYCCLGHALFALNQPDEARNAYQSSVALHRNAGNNHLAMEPLAGLVRVALAKGDTKQAIMDAEEIWAHLATGTLHGTDEPIRVMLSVYQAFATAQDPRAKTVLHTAYQLLQTRSLRISDPVRRQSFMENILAHRELQKIWASQSSTDE
jgi:tetratricopeptide (TPR) repeat protein